MSSEPVYVPAEQGDGVWVSTYAGPAGVGRLIEIETAGQPAGLRPEQAARLGAELVRALIDVQGDTPAARLMLSMLAALVVWFEDLSGT